MARVQLVVRVERVTRFTADVPLKVDETVTNEIAVPGITITGVDDFFIM